MIPCDILGDISCDIIGQWYGWWYINLILIHILNDSRFLDLDFYEREVDWNKSLNKFWIVNFTSLNVWFAFFNSQVRGLYYSLFEIKKANDVARKALKKHCYRM